MSIKELTTSERTILKMLLEDEIRKMEANHQAMDLNRRYLNELRILLEKIACDL